MTTRTIFLVYGYDAYEYPYDPIKAFSSEDDAMAFLQVISDYQKRKPESPSGEASEGENEAWWNSYVAWTEAHPAKDSDHHDGFDVMELDLEEKP